MTGEAGAATSDPEGLDALRALGARVARGDGGVFHFPIRHHSPACALHLARALAEIDPGTLVLEMPADFAPLLPLILDPATRPPVAVVTVAAAGGEAPAPTGYWPLSASSPELAALRHSARAGARIVLADLPSGARLAEPETPPERDGDDEQPPAPPPASPEPTALTDEHALSYSDYALALVRRTGARDFNELWDRLFESRAAEADWRGFFADVAVHCALSRRASDPAEAERDGTLARERAMRNALRGALAGAGGRPVAVVTGGFHTPALLALGAVEPAPPPAGRDARAYLVRYGHRNLDRLNGYAAGMPSPRYCELLAAAAAYGAAEPFAAAAEEVLVGLAARLRAERPGFAPALPTLVAALAQARGLAELRDLPGPGRSEILDAALSCFVKDEDPRHGSPLMEALARELTGDAIGDVPAGAGSPPIVEAARARARALAFRVDDGMERRRELDIHRKPRHRAASRFLHAMALLGTGFGRKLQGPDFRAGGGVEALFEVWTCAWSPPVEGRLVALAGDGDSVERACAAELRRRASALEAQGAARDSQAAADLVLVAAQAGVASAGGDFAALLGRAIAGDPEFPRVVACLGTLAVLWRGRAVLGLTGAPALVPLLGAAYRRAIDLLPRVASAQGDAVAAAAGALAGLHHLLEAPGPDRGPFDRELLDAGVAALLAADLPPLLAGVVGALAHLAGRLDGSALSRLVCGALGGGAAPEERSAPLSGLLMVQPALLRRVEPLVAGIDAVFEGIDEGEFLALLPGLRLALTALDPHETDDLARRVARLKGLAGPLLPLGEAEVTAAEAIANAHRSRALLACLAADGLAGWLDAGPGGAA